MQKKSNDKYLLEIAAVFNRKESILTKGILLLLAFSFDSP